MVRVDTERPISAAPIFISLVGNVLAVLLVDQPPVLLLARFTAVFQHFALFALLEGEWLVRLVPVEDQAVGTLVQQVWLGYRYISYN